MVIAQEAAKKVHHPVVERNLGSYLLGSTVPDIRIITDISRKETHFVDLENDRGESGVSLFFKAHPELIDAARLGASTQAFVAGYLCHLVTDEIWIFDIYRLFFGRSSPLGNDPAANMVDRALQFELDRRERLNRIKMGAIGAQLADSDAGVDIGFIAPEALQRWKEFVCTEASREPSWEHFRFFAGRFLTPEQRIEPGQLDSFFDTIPDMLERAFRVVTLPRIKLFREQAIIGSIRAAGEYLK